MLLRIRTEGKLEDKRYKERVAELDVAPYGRARAELGVHAPMAVSEAVGQALHALTLAARPGLAVEFGTSLGVSTIYLAGALRDLGSGRIVTSELLPEKASVASENLSAAGLLDLVEVRVGDARETLSDLDAEIDLLFLDGSNDLYVPLLELLAPRLSRRALILADMSHHDPHHDSYREYVAARYVTSELPLDAGLVVSALGG